MTKAKAMDSLIPMDDEDAEDFMDRCTSDGNEESECAMAWSDANKSIRRTIVAEGAGLDYIMSDATSDHYGDTILSAGWDVAWFNRNPIALFNHNADAPIGTWKNLRVDGKALRGTLQLANAGTSARIDELRSLVEQGILRAVSVGFKPLKAEPIETGKKGVRYLQQQLLECSLVSVPANPNALQVMKTLKISEATQKMVFGEQAVTRSSNAALRSRGEHADNHSQRRSTVMSTPLTKRIEDAQTKLIANQDALRAHLEAIDDENVTDAELETTTALNEAIDRQQKALDALKAAESRIAVVSRSEEGTQLAVLDDRQATQTQQRSGIQFAYPAKKVTPLDHIFRSLTVAVKHRGEQNRRSILDVLADTYGVNQTSELTRHVMRQMVTRAATVPADTTTTGWAVELVTTAIAEFMQSLMPVSIYPQLASRGGTFTFGTNGVVTIPYRSATPTIAGAFVGQLSPIPVKQGAFNAITLTPKKMGVISSFSREIAEHSTPAIEGLIRQAIIEDTAVALDSILLDANAATAVRPAGLRSGVAALGPTGGGAVAAAIVGDAKLMVNALSSAASGNIRSPVWLINPSDALTIGFMPVSATGDYPFKADIAAGTFMGIPMIQSTSVTADTWYLVDAADFVTATGNVPRFDVSDQATITLEDTTPLPIVDGSSTPAPNTRSLWQTDSMAVRMILEVNWAMRRTGMIQYVTTLGWN